jgi:hypothetical protein
MSVAGISSSSLANLGNVNAQNQSQWAEQFQLLEQQLQTGNTSATAQNTASSEFAALQAQGSPTTPASTTPAVNANAPTSAAGTLNPQPVGPAKWQNTENQPPHSHLHHHFRVDAGDGNLGSQQSNPLESAYPPGSSSTAQQAYNSWQQDLQQVALNTDLLTAQGADWQPASGNVSISA